LAAVTFHDSIALLAEGGVRLCCNSINIALLAQGRTLKMSNLDPPTPLVGLGNDFHRLHSDRPLVQVRHVELFEEYPEGEHYD
jgi:hypothetical protein